MSLVIAPNLACSCTAPGRAPRRQMSHSIPLWPSFSRACFFCLGGSMWNQHFTSCSISSYPHSYSAGWQRRVEAIAVLTLHCLQGWEIWCTASVHPSMPRAMIHRIDPTQLHRWVGTVSFSCIAVWPRPHVSP